jgi:cytochrome c553
MKALPLLLVAGLGIAATAHAAGDAEAGKAKSTVCAACHGADGNSTVPSFPRLAGQNRDYLVHALHAYRSGDRKNPIMAEQAKNLSNQDIDDLALYFSRQHGLYLKY